MFLSHVAIPAESIHRVKGELKPAEALEGLFPDLEGIRLPSARMAALRLIYLGLGEDGHTASLFPGSPVSVTEPVLPITAHYQDRPANHVTLTPLVFNEARMVVFMATGEKKAATLAEVFNDTHARNPELYPAQRIKPKEGRLIWLVDETAASQLPNEMK